MKVLAEMNLFKKNKKGDSEIDMGGAMIIAIVILAIIAFAILIITGKLSQIAEFIQNLFRR